MEIAVPHVTSTIGAAVRPDAHDILLGAEDGFVETGDRASRMASVAMP